MTLYLDTSALVPLFLAEARSDELTYLIDEADAITISDFGAGEFAAAISTALRIERITEADATAILRDFDQWRHLHPKVVKLEPRHMELGTNLVRRFDLALRLPDALHIAICLDLPATLVTGDKTQAIAAETLSADVHRV